MQVFFNVSQLFGKVFQIKRAAHQVQAWICLLQTHNQ